MKPNQAADLQARWKQQEHSYKCPHAAVEMEWTENGYYTGIYHCRACGAMIVPPRTSNNLFAAWA